jgi:hypothetical protein
MDAIFANMEVLIIESGFMIKLFEGLRPPSGSQRFNHYFNGSLSH